MDKRLRKEQELDQAIGKMEKTVIAVKKLAKSVKQRLVSKVELQQTIDKLKEQANEVRILSVEAKMFGQWKIMDEKLPLSSMTNKFLILISLIALLYLAKN